MSDRNDGSRNIRPILAALVVSLSLALAACGGGSSGSVASTPAPTPSPSPTPVNASLAELTQSQSFTNDSSGLSANFDLSTRTTIDGKLNADTLTIRYDATTKGYTVTSGSRSQTFTSANVTRRESDLVEYRNTAGSGQILSLFTETGTAAKRKYVGMGFWQSNSEVSSRQSSDFSAFAYGLPTNATAVPRTGSAAYAIDIFGAVIAPGIEPKSFSGSGKFSLDFAQGQFSALASAYEYGLGTGSETSGGGIELRAGGLLSSSDGTFTGNAFYGSTLGNSAGTISGRLFGPQGQEIGATFQTSNAAGMAAIGSLAGARDTSSLAENLTLTALRSEQRFLTFGGGGIGSITLIGPDTFDFVGYSSDMVGGRFTANEKVASSNPNFTAYEKTGDNGYGPQKVRIELFKPGTANTEIALTYASFGKWTGSGSNTVGTHYFTYGFQTANGLLAARTGRARYEGIAYGSGLNSNASASYDIKGTTSFDVDFSTQKFGGTLALTGVERTSGTRADFGAYALGGDLFLQQSYLLGNITRAGSSVGNVWGEFYGPNGQELGGSFYLNAPAGSGEAREVGIKGAFVTVGK
ncbi:transferrin-binding protein-like solute binding protein [Novosphingobium taihuense]|uniref:Transferrin-binding protein B C-lobe/N-lobe beta-barrel domain-containing protein n=1 Tax=Novosphingobium taihuense TaxID=260085 RepID=A0A7W7EUZ4_9SPHN|nr:transferrin-binding protein-like solute binding protein [Novosphingobium taihuense]MBB4614928.1 hypothetical protein [Novosphingobium taihuense]